MIVVGARLEGPTRARELRLALDTAATMTLIVPEVMDDVGYGCGSFTSREADRIPSTSVGLPLGGRVADGNYVSSSETAMCVPRRLRRGLSSKSAPPISANSRAENANAMLETGRAATKRARYAPSRVCSGGLTN